MKNIRILDVKSQTSISGNISTHLVKFKLGISDIEYSGVFTQYDKNLLPLKDVINSDIKSNGLNHYK